jgi:hypothetical protein
MEQHCIPKHLEQEIPVLAQIGFGLEFSPRKQYSKFNQAERPYATLKTRPNVLPFTAAGDAGATRKICVRGGA